MVSTIAYFEEVESEGQLSIPKRKPQASWDYLFGAGEETLTLDLFLGKEAL